MIALRAPDTQHSVNLNKYQKYGSRRVCHFIQLHLPDEHGQSSKLKKKVKWIYISTSIIHISTFFILKWIFQKTAIRRRRTIAWINMCMMIHNSPKTVKGLYRSNSPSGYFDVALDLKRRVISQPISIKYPLKSSSKYNRLTSVHLQALLRVMSLPRAASTCQETWFRPHFLV